MPSKWTPSHKKENPITCTPTALVKLATPLACTHDASPLTERSLQHFQLPFQSRDGRCYRNVVFDGLTVSIEAAKSHLLGFGRGACTRARQRVTRIMSIITIRMRRLAAIGYFTHVARITTLCNLRAIVRGLAARPEPTISIGAILLFIGFACACSGSQAKLRLRGGTTVWDCFTFEAIVTRIPKATRISSLAAIALIARTHPPHIPVRRCERTMGASAYSPEA